MICFKSVDSFRVCFECIIYPGSDKLISHICSTVTSSRAHVFSSHHRFCKMQNGKHIRSHARTHSLFKHGYLLCHAQFINVYDLDSGVQCISTNLRFWVLILSPSMLTFTPGCFNAACDGCVATTANHIENISI